VRAIDRSFPHTSFWRPESSSKGKLDTRNNRDFGDALIRAVFDEVSVGI
jgi:hypothetical protein